MHAMWIDLYSVVNQLISFLKAGDFILKKCKLIHMCVSLFKCQVIQFNCHKYPEIVSRSLEIKLRNYMSRYMNLKMT